MKDLVRADIEDYILSLLPERDPVLTRMERQAKERDIPIVGPVVGRLLHQLALMVQARNVFELGSAIGYSTIWWARALPAGGRVVYTDSSRANADEASANFDEAGVAAKVRVEIGDAMEALAAHKEEIDIVFCDLDKVAYPSALRAALPKLRHGGLFVADNVLWSGKVTRPAGEHDASTAAIVELNKELYASDELFSIIIPIRDGVAVAVKR